MAGGGTVYERFQANLLGQITGGFTSFTPETLKKGLRVQGKLKQVKIHNSDGKRLVMVGMTRVGIDNHVVGG